MGKTNANGKKPHKYDHRTGIQKRSQEHLTRRVQNSIQKASETIKRGNDAQNLWRHNSIPETVVQLVMDSSTGDARLTSPQQNTSQQNDYPKLSPIESVLDPYVTAHSNNSNPPTNSTFQIQAVNGQEYMPSIQPAQSIAYPQPYYSTLPPQMCETFYGQMQEQGPLYWNQNGAYEYQSSSSNSQPNYYYDPKQNNQ